MLDNIMDLIRSNAGDSIVKNPAVPNEKNEAAIAQGGSSILDTLKGALSGGRLNDVLGYFKNEGSGSNELVSEATNNYANNLQAKLGLGKGEASDVASKLIPAAMSQLASKTNNPADSSFNIQDIFNQLSGGKTGGLNIQALLNKFGGAQLDKDHDGDVDFQDLKSMFAGDAGSGMMDTVKGMFNKK